MGIQTGQKREDVPIQMIQTRKGVTGIMKKFRKKLSEIRRSEKGFTLVELIVVIAIIGILAAIGAVVYSGYIEDAREVSDWERINDYADAIQLGAADQGMTDTDEDWGTLYYEPDEGKWVIEIDDPEAFQAALACGSGDEYYAATLRVIMGYSEDSAYSTAEAAAEALVDHWLEEGVGEDWETMKLKSDLYTTDNTMIGIPSGNIDTQSTISKYVEDYAASSYIGSEETLMTAVGAVSTTFGELVGEGETGALALQGLLELSDEEWAEFCEAYGIGTYDEETGTYDYSDVTSTELGNAMVMYMASQIDSEYDSETLAAFLEDYSDGEVTDFEGFSALTLSYGIISAYRQSDYCTDDFAEAYDAFLEMDFSDYSAQGYSSAGAYAYALFEEVLDVSDDTGFAEYKASESYETDATAFVSLMSALTELSTTDEDFISSFSDLSSLSWYESGSTSDMYTYLVALLAEYGYDVTSGS